MLVLFQCCRVLLIPAGIAARTPPSSSIAWIAALVWLILCLLFWFIVGLLGALRRRLLSVFVGALVVAITIVS